MEDLRKAKRVSFSAPIEQLLMHNSDYPRLGGDDVFLAATALNLSTGGIACEARQKIEPLSPVYFIFSVPTPGGSRRIRCEGYIAHSNYDGERCVFGISFSDLSSEDQAAIDAYIASAQEKN